MFHAATTSMRQVEGVMGVTVVREENQRRVSGDSLSRSSLCDERGTQSCGEMPLDERGTRRVSGDSLSRSSLCDERAPGVVARCRVMNGARGEFREIRYPAHRFAM